ncbi:hypothetical protein KBD69_04525 [Candidatus Woesebacteria bacterium]|nr:hypothetical protein [Candidatus Woesebacteria bacterium]
MMQDVQKHKLAYSLLAATSIVYLGLVFTLRNMPQVLLYATVVYGVIYLIWGLIHHLTLKDLTGRTVLEYVLVTALGIVVMSTLVL